MSLTPQATIEQNAGITPEIAAHMMAKKTYAAANAYRLLGVLLGKYDEDNMQLLRQSVAACVEEIEAKKWFDLSRKVPHNKIIGEA